MQSKNRPDWYISEEEGIKVHWLKNPYSNKMKYSDRIRSFLKFALFSAHRASSIDADIVFATSTPLTIALPGIYTAHRKKLPMVFEVRDLWPELPIAVGALKNPIFIKLARELEKLAYRNSTRIIALSPGMKAGILNTGYSEDRVTIIPNSCDIEFFKINTKFNKKVRSENKWLGDRPFLLYAGALGTINGVDYLAKVASISAEIDPKIAFVVLGDGREQDNVIHEAQNLGILNRNFFILPPVNKYQIPYWFAAADMAISLFLNIEEMWNNSANKFFDALAAGKPIAINYRGWQADLISESGCGLLLDPINLEDAAHKIVNKINDKNWLKKAGQAARNIGQERFCRDKLSKILEQVMADAIMKN
jgi:glycosyltransferase involved in cell wall biosynthesis